MNWEPVRRFLVIAVYFGVASIGFRAILGDCPPCAKRVFLEAGARHGTTSDGRRIVKVCIDGSWDVSPGQTDSRMWNAVSGAISDWNDVQGGSGARIPYFFELDQSSLNDDCTVRIEQVNNYASSACAITRFQTNISVNPPSGAVEKMMVPLFTANSMTPAGLRGTVGHELGHAMGLSGSIGDCCPTGSETAAGYSIMGHALPGCIGVYTASVQSRDVDQVREQFADSMSNCTRTVLTMADLPPACADPCDDLSCPGFDETMCANSSQTNDECIEEGSCYSVWAVTSYYLCDGSGCQYLYSDWDFIGYECNVLFDPCG